METTDAGDRLRQSGLRVTPQRRAILDAFRGGSAEHLSADEVHSRASASLPELGRGTVYATLAELTELELIGSVDNPEPVRYETNLGAHDHFRCRLCLRLFDVELGGAELARRPLSGFRVESVTVVAEGICAECVDYERGLAEGAEAVREQPLLSGDELAGLTCARVDSPLGELALAASDSGVVRIAFPDHADYDQLVARARSRRGPHAGRARVEQLGRGLTGYLSGSHLPLADLVDWRLSSQLVAGVLNAVTEIPWAGSVSYERVMDGLSPRECGRAMGANPLPLLIPCHRVSCGSLRPDVYVGGAERLHFLQALEAA